MYEITIEEFNNLPLYDISYIKKYLDNTMVGKMFSLEDNPVSLPGVFPVMVFDGIDDGFPMVSLGTIKVI